MDAEGLGFLSSLNRGELGNMGSGSVFRFGRTLGLGFGFSGDCEISALACLPSELRSL